MLPSPRESVIILHGLGRTAISMAWMERALKKAGFATINKSYAFRRGPISQLAEEIIEPRLEQARANGAERVHFVTHSLGGILLRQYDEHNKMQDGSRAVMIAPPNQGSELVDYFRELPPLHWFCGPAFGELSTDVNSIPNILGPIDLETGVIAGERNLFPGFARHFEGPSDGIVAIERTKVSGMADWTIVPHSHTFIMNAPDTIRQTLCFLKEGRFESDQTQTDLSS